jgi:hypothetical protein
MARWTAISLDAGMHHQTHMIFPNGFRDGAFEIWRDDQIRFEERRRFNGHRVINVELEGDFVPSSGQLDKQALREAVETVRQKEDSHEF